MAEEQENGGEEELDIDALLDDVADSAPEEEAAEEAVDIDDMLDEVSDEVDADTAPAEEAVEEPVEDAVMEEPAVEEAPEEPVETEAPVEEDMDAVLDNIADPAAAAPASAPAPAAADAGSADMGGLLGQLTAVAARIEQATEKGEFITQQLEERHSAAERFVKGVKEVSKEMKEERPSLTNVEKSGKLGMILGGVTLLLSGAVLGLVVTEDKVTLPGQVEAVGAAVDGISENVNLIAGRIFEQQEQMDEAISSMKGFEEALAKIPEPAPPPAPAAEEASSEAPSEAEPATVAVDFTAVEEKLDATQQQILVLHELLKGREGHYPGLKRQLEQVIQGQGQLQQGQVKLFQVQQEMKEEKAKKQSIYKFP